MKKNILSTIFKKIIGKPKLENFNVYSKLMEKPNLFEKYTSLEKELRDRTDISSSFVLLICTGVVALLKISSMEARREISYTIGLVLLLTILHKIAILGSIRTQFINIERLVNVKKTHGIRAWNATAGFLFIICLIIGGLMCLLTIAEKEIKKMQKINEIEKIVKVNEIEKMNEEFKELKLFKFHNFLEKYDGESIK
ncbi:hypothetical protein M2102_001471 [Fusobacterium sp. PH5-7]|uniref:hypothetical protein n=1 Tax=Fusobacterium sp. PH5-7 TaxID=2940528 RepID=UPI002475E145|nr:hypothetical protein [Fusobacterium sp. PH5-7]MDH6457842.1 hypothetical protein [Fusobacterium sp. PH5-7]